MLFIWEFIGGPKKNPSTKVKCHCDPSQGVCVYVTGFPQWALLAYCWFFETGLQVTQAGLELG